MIDNTIIKVTKKAIYINLVKKREKMRQGYPGFRRRFN